MRRRYKVCGLVGIISAIMLFGTMASATVNINFDEFTSPPVTCCYADTGVIGPLVYPDVTITDPNNQGYVMNNLGWSDMETSAPNLFGTLSGTILLNFNKDVSNVGLDVINGTGPADFTVTALDQLNNVLFTQTQSLNTYTTSGSVWNFDANVAGIRNVTIAGNGDFAIDTISYNTSTVPEPATLLLLGSGLASLAGLGWRRMR